jgi:hypothetical protein
VHRFVAFYRMVVIAGIVAGCSPVEAHVRQAPIFEVDPW